MRIFDGLFFLNPGMKGLVSVADRSWKDMLAEMMKTNHTICDLLLGKRAPFVWEDDCFHVK
jgi:hypothetical protein